MSEMILLSLNLQVYCLEQKDIFLPQLLLGSKVQLIFQIPLFVSWLVGSVEKGLPSL